MYVSAYAKKIFHTSLLFILIASSTINAQSAKSFLKGTVTDYSTGLPIFGVTVNETGRSNNTKTTTAGEYQLKISKGTKNVSFALSGYQTKIVSNLKITDNESAWLDIILFPLTSTPRPTGKNKPGASDSLDSKDSIIRLSFATELNSVVYNEAALKEASDGTLLMAKNTNPGANRDLPNLLKRLNAVNLSNFSRPGSPVNFMINGMGERYNQLMLNGAVVSSADQYSRAFVLDIIPIEMIEKASVSKTGSASIPGDYTGGSISVTTKDMPDRDFFYMQGGVGIFDKTQNKDFYNDKGSKGQFFSMKSSIGELQAAFPTTRSPQAFNQYNLQERIYFSRQLDNNIGPVSSGNAKPADKLLVGFGKIIKFKKAATIGVTGFIIQQKAEQFNTDSTQVSINAANNPFPFSDLTKKLVGSQSSDSSYTFASQSSALLNGTILYGNNKISLKSIYASQYISIFNRRSDVSSPDTDPLANAGVYYKTEQRKFVNIQLAGEHALGFRNQLRLDWQASYLLYRQLNPDERNFILREDTTGNKTFEIGNRQGATGDITGSGRLWRNLTEHNYTGAFNISFPFNMFSKPQVLSGGVSINTRYRVFHSDLLLTNGAGYFTLNNMLSPERYYPGGNGLSVTNYYSNSPSSAFGSNFNDRGNYVASANLGAVHLQLESKIRQQLAIKWGIRVESNSQLVSSSGYDYTAGFRYPQVRTVDQNFTVGKLSLLPSVQIKYDFLRKFQLHGAAYRSVNRPQLQELSVYRYYDASIFQVNTGNAELRNSHIENYSAGISWAANTKSYLSVTGFYKKIDQPIENIVSSYGVATMLHKPYNTTPATNKGVSAAININLNPPAKNNWLSGINLFAAATYTDSKVEAGPLKSTAIPFVTAHTLSGTPTYSYNGGVVFQYKNLPQLTALYNGNTGFITAIGSGAVVTLANGNKISATPDYRVNKTEQLDLQISQKLFKQKVQLIAGVNNLLNGTYTIYQDLNGNKKMDQQLLVGSYNDQPGYYRTGTDNIITNIKTQKNYYITLSFLFR